MKSFSNLCFYYLCFSYCGLVFRVSEAHGKTDTELISNGSSVGGSSVGGSSVGGSSVKRSLTKLNFDCICKSLLGFMTDEYTQAGSCKATLYK